MVNVVIVVLINVLLCFGVVSVEWDFICLFGNVWWCLFGGLCWLFVWVLM